MSSRECSGRRSLSACDRYPAALRHTVRISGLGPQLRLPADLGAGQHDHRPGRGVDGRSRLADGVSGLPGHARLPSVLAWIDSAQRTSRNRRGLDRERRRGGRQPLVHPGALLPLSAHARSGLLAGQLAAHRAGRSVAALPGHERVRSAGSARGRRLDGPAGRALQRAVRQRPVRRGAAGGGRHGGDHRSRAGCSAECCCRCVRAVESAAVGGSLLGGLAFRRASGETEGAAARMVHALPQRRHHLQPAFLSALRGFPGVRRLLRHPGQPAGGVVRTGR